MIRDWCGVDLGMWWCVIVVGGLLYFVCVCVGGGMSGSNGCVMWFWGSWGSGGIGCGVVMCGCIVV